MIKLNKEYNSSENEPKINKLWQESGFFNPDNLVLPKNTKTYTIILPPPNVTDRLHLGHASMLALEDLMIRFKRLNGYRTLWLPGTDHAAIATQTVVEKQLYKETGQTRHDLGREKFLAEVKKFAITTQKTILEQIKAFGASLDWSRLAFTLDDERQKAVKKMFVEMYEAGVLYRGERIVNWCPYCQSTLADDEVEYQEELITLYTFKYDVNFPIAISTTRPETKLGDTAVAVNPKDERYKKYVGQTLSADFCGQELSLKVIADYEVDPTFGTGALGVTPAHSMIDWLIAEVNKLEIIKVIDEQGKIRPGFGKYSGKKVKLAREMIIEELKRNKLIIKEEEISHNISVCYRCGTAIEPLPSLQWFVAVDKPLKRLKGKSLKQAAIEVVGKNKIKFIPDRFRKRYLDWMTNLRDWCISRQIWFGHQIPVYYRDDEIYVGLKAPQENDWIQDQDTLDTWFSSGMWTFSTLDWPQDFKNNKKTGNLAKFHPTQVLETGYEIITLWVSRMIMMSLFALGEIPFENVYLHGMVLDKQGKKMSKSKGNGIDPVEVINKYGCDAVRLSLLLGNTPGIDVKISEEKIASFRNFTNKLWNIARYILSQEQSKEKIDNKKLTLAEQWILSRLQTTITDVIDKINKFDFSSSGEILRIFTLDDLADWYLEASKFDQSTEKNKVLQLILETILKLWHPFMPFVTETIWQSFNQNLLMVSNWPEVNKKLINYQAEKEFNLVKDLIVTIRNLRSEHGLAPAQKLTAQIYAGQNSKLLIEASNLIKALRTGLKEVKIITSRQPLQGALYGVSQGIEIYLEVEVDVAQEKERLQKEFNQIKKLFNNLEIRLADQEFISKAPAKIIEQEKNKLAEYKSSLEKISERLKKLS